MVDPATILVLGRQLGPFAGRSAWRRFGWATLLPFSVARSKRSSQVPPT